MLRVQADRDERVDIDPPRPRTPAPGNRRILIVDDNKAIHDDFAKVLGGTAAPASDLAAVESELFGEPVQLDARERFSLDHAHQGEDGIRMVGEAKAAGHPYALAFVDVRMPPGCDGIETAVRMWEADPQVQVVICTAHADYSWAQMLDRLGVTERWVVLHKPFDAVEVRQLALAFTRKWDGARENRAYAQSLEDEVRRRTVALEEANRTLATEMGKLREAERRVHHMAHHDSLTGLPNRRFLETHLRYQIEQARRSSRTMAVMSVDLDRFKWVNDNLGHEAGDEVLRIVSERLTACLRRGDCVVRGDATPEETGTSGTVARLGGDEFVVLLSEVSGAQDVVAVARRILATVAQPITVAGRELSQGASIGIAVLPSDGDKADELMRKADTAMYQAKEAGRNTFQFYADSAQQHMHDRLWLDNEMRRALVRGELELHYQPEMDGARGLAIGAEGLMRWRHPERGPITPAEFIPVAEESGFIVEMGAWALREACRQASAWIAAGLPLRQVAVNVSARQLRSPTLVETVEEALAAARLPASAIELEITEGALAAEREDTDRTLRRLKELGLRLALDDFGTGYSSLKHLMRWPIDTLKIDRSFTARMTEDRRSAGVVRAILALARSFDLEVIAEGVETTAQRDALLAQGCSRMQGYLFCKPIPGVELARWVQSAGAVVPPLAAAR